MFFISTLQRNVRLESSSVTTDSASPVAGSVTTGETVHKERMRTLLTVLEVRELVLFTDPVPRYCIRLANVQQPELHMSGLRCHNINMIQDVKV